MGQKARIVGININRAVIAFLKFIFLAKEGRYNLRSWFLRWKSLGRV